jgi:hypothetical protein
MTDDSARDSALDRLTRVLLFVWVVLLIPWVLFAALVGMSFDSGNKWAATLIVLSTWSYGPAVFAAFKLLDRSRKAIFIPLISIGGAFLFSFLERVTR